MTGLYKLPICQKPPNGSKKGKDGQAAFAFIR
jgi:hypothetical protein